jgi:hypothetical protein
LTDEPIEQAPSTELTGGAGFTYEDTVVAYYLAALLREERAAPLNGIVKSVAVQQDGHGHPMDDIIVELERCKGVIIPPSGRDVVDQSVEGNDAVAFQRLRHGGRPTDEVIRSVIEGNESYAVLGLALVLALETYDVSETTLPMKHIRPQPLRLHRLLNRPLLQQ